jgi:hypothetical protein
MFRATMRTTLATLAAVFTFTAGLAAAHEPGPFDVKQVDAKQALPRGVKAKGKTVEQVWTWQDGDLQTDGLAVFSSTDVKNGRKIFVQLYRGKGGKLKEVRLVQDSVTCTDGDMTAAFVDGSATVTDEDTDEVSELTFAYDLNCTTDVSPATRKLILLEGKDKHALRGTSQVDIGNNEKVGGEFKADPFKRAPELKAYAEARWKELLGK